MERKIGSPDLKLPMIGYCSTAGPGNKISLILVPLMATAGVSVLLLPLLTEGITLRKFESILGVKTSLSREKFQEQLLKAGGIIASLIEAPASSRQEDYCIDPPSVSGLGLAEIEGLFSSQKMARGIQGIVFDIKVGEGSFLKNRQEARILASGLEGVCHRLGIRSSFLLSNLDQPLGISIGNSLEVREAINVLQGSGPLDVLKLSLELGSEILLLAKKFKIKTVAKSFLKRKIEQCKALQKFEDIIKAQGGNPILVTNDFLFPKAKLRRKVYSIEKGYLHRIKMEEINDLWKEFSASQQERDESGFLIFKKIGDKIDKDETIAEVHLDKPVLFPEVKRRLRETFVLSKTPPDFKPFIIESIRKN